MVTGSVGFSFPQGISNLLVPEPSDPMAAHWMTVPCERLVLRHEWQRFSYWFRGGGWGGGDVQAWNHYDDDGSQKPGKMLAGAMNWGIRQKVVLYERNGKRCDVVLQLRF